MRRLCFALLSLTAIAPAQGLDKRITASYPPQSLGRMIPALAKQTGVDLRVARAVENDVVMVRVKDVPVDLLIHRIAEVTNRVWEKQGDRYTITSLSDADRAAEKRVLARRTEIIRKAIAKLVADPVYKTPWTQDEAIKLANKTETLLNPKDNRLDARKINFKEFAGRAPTDRAITALLAEMDPAELARTWTDKRVYATHPTSMQHPLPNEAQGILERLLREQSMFVDASNDFKDRLGPRTSSFAMGGINRGEFRKGNPKLGIGKGLLRIEGSEIGYSLIASLTLTDAAGVSLLDGFISVPIDPLEPVKFAPKGSEGKVTADSLVKEIGEAKAESSSNGSRMSMTTSDGKETVRLDVPYNPPQRKTPLSADLKRLLLSPNGTDPLELCTGKILQAAAEMRDENLVACLDDGVFTTSVSQLVKGVTPSEFLSSQNFQEYQDVVDSGGWITIQPKNPAATHKRRTDRDALAKLMQSIDRNKLLLLDDLCAFSLSQEEPAGDQKMDLTYVRLLNPGAASGSYDPFKWHVYQFFGSLTREQKQALGSGAGVPVQNLTPSARKALNEYIFNAYVEPQLTKADGTPIDVWSDGVVTDWTQLLPGGLQERAMVTANVKQDEAAYCVDSRIDSAQILSAEALGTRQFVGETPGLQQGALRFDRFSPATQWTYSFNIALAPGIAIKPDLTDGAINGATANPDLKSLPDGFQKQLAERIGQLRKHFGNTDFTGQRQGIPPGP